MRHEEFGRGQNTELGWNDPTFGPDCVAKVAHGVVPAHRRGKELCFARAQNSEHATCNAGCNASRMMKGEETLGTLESTIKATEDHHPPGPPGGRRQTQPGQVRGIH